jgi:chemotaxis protein MotB
MKKLFFGIISIAIVLNSCVTKQKYTECTDNLADCEKARKTLTSQKLDLDNQVTELSTQRSKMQEQIRGLEADTLKLSRLNREMNENHVLLQTNYDELSAAYKSMSAGSKKEAEAMLAQLQEAQRKLSEKEKDLEEKSTKLIELQAILDKKDADVQALKDKIKAALKGFEGSGLEVTEKNGKVYVSMDEKLLFATGKFTIDARGESALKELAKVLETDEDINVTVEGHTDDVPFSPSTAAQIRDNWDLSVMRATTVVKTLLKYGDIDSKRLTASGRGEYVPLDTDDTKEARAKNRRTEIILTPKLDALFEILE